MSTIWVAAILIAATVIPIYLFIYANKRSRKRRLETLFNRFTNAGAKHGLSFTQHEVLKDKLIGLDADQRKLLVVPTDASEADTVVDLAGLKTCTKQEDFIHVLSSTDKHSKPERVLMTMGLKIEFDDSRQPAIIVFYDGRTDTIQDLPELEDTVKKWQGLLLQKQTPVSVTGHHPGSLSLKPILQP